MRAQAILFDKDGTLFDFQKTWAGWAGGLIRSHAGGDLGLAADIANAWGFDLAANEFCPDSVVIAGTAQETVEAVLHFYPGRSVDGLVEDFSLAAAQVVPTEAAPLLPFLTRLTDAGLKIGIATNDAEAPARAQLDRFAVTEMFDFIAGYDTGYGSKPAPGMCIAFADQMEIEPENIAMIGDSLHDLHAGRAAGMQCVGVLTGVATRQELAPYSDVVLPDISHLSDWLES